MKKIPISIIFLVVIFMVLLSGCEERETLPTKPVIKLFNVSPNQINLGDTAILTWEVSNADTVTIDNDIGNVGLSGTRIIQPVKTTTYKITAINSAGSKYATTQIIINGFEEPESASVVVKNEASKIKITLTSGGGNYPATGYDYDTSVTIKLNGIVLDETGITGTGWMIGGNLYIGMSGITAILDDVASDVSILASGTYSITVVIYNTVIYDDSIWINHKTESASVVVKNEASKIKITLTTGGDNYPVTGYDYDTSVTIKLNGTILSETGITGTAWMIGGSLYIGGAVPILDDVASDVSALAAGTYSITVVIYNSVIYDDSIRIV